MQTSADATPVRAERGAAQSSRAAFERRARRQARLERIWRWEFWPQWLFYAPVVPWIAALAARHRSLAVMTAANPGIPHGGVVGESKFAILSRLPPDAIVPSALLAAGPFAERRSALERLLAQPGWRFPLVLKPDAGQRGAAVRFVRDLGSALSYLERCAWPVLAQVCDPGPHEAGVFYVRHPDEATGRIFTITDKQFPELIGDGRTPLRELIWRHPRFRMQADVFLARHRLLHDCVLADGERFVLAQAGNHCQGALFRDGGRLLTPALVRAIDRIALAFDGFFFGRFDVRYADPDAFRAGRGFRIVELNGVTSESTNIYDPEWSLLRAYRVLFEQWRLLFAIGAANRRRGVRPSSWRSVWADAREFYRSRRPEPLSD